MDFAQTIINFYKNLSPPPLIPEGVEVLWPYSNPEVARVIQVFYETYFSGHKERIFLIGINPGRFGAGQTGIGFTDPFRLKNDCGIAHTIPGKKELSSTFVYELVRGFGGPASFFSRCYFTALSPAGYIQDGKNLNYYDVPGFADAIEEWMAQAMEVQIRAGANRRVAFSMGRGKNYKYLKSFNERHGFFERIEPLPHPRWIMQYRYKKMDKFVDEYRQALTRNGN